MRLLFITQKLKDQDAFGALWIREFIRQGFELEVVCLEGGKKRQEGEKGQERQGWQKGEKRQEGQEGGEEFEFPVYSLGKEHGATRLQSVLRFEKLITTLSYDRVFIHMAPVWYALGCWWWILRRTPTYLWYTHYTMQLGVRLFGWFGTRFFCATPQSLPQYPSIDSNISGHVLVKKTVLGHGIDLAFWPKRQNIAVDSHRLLVVHRLSRSKRLELVLRALPLLDSSYTLDVYGIEAEPDYVSELKNIVDELSLQSRVTFHGTIAMAELPQIYTKHRFILNMASETIDKTMLEAMTCGCFPVTTAGNAEAIGGLMAPSVDTSEAIAEFVRKYAEKLPVDEERMFEIVKKNHSLEGLVKRMGEYMKKGE